MTIREIEDYYMRLAKYYESKGNALWQKAQNHQSRNEFDKALAMITSAGENFEKARLCNNFVSVLAESEIQKDCK